MAEKIIRIRRKRRSRSFPSVESFATFRFHFSAVRLAVLIAVTAIAFALTIIFFSYGSKLYTGWREARLLRRATAMLEKNDFKAANQAARRVLEMHRESLPAFYVLAEASEKQNLEETVA